MTEINGGTTYISIHAPRVGRDPAEATSVGKLLDFNPRAPCGARLWFHSHKSRGRYFNPRAPCGARLSAIDIPHVPTAFQSTRPVWGATMNPGVRTGARNFNPRAPCGARRKTPAPCAARCNFNPRAPCGARRNALSLPWASTLYFNPRAPCGARREVVKKMCREVLFQSTRPVWGATAVMKKLDAIE